MLITGEVSLEVYMDSLYYPCNFAVPLKLF